MSRSRAFATVRVAVLLAPLLVAACRGTDTSVASRAFATNHAILAMIPTMPEAHEIGRTKDEGIRGEERTPYEYDSTQVWEVPGGTSRSEVASFFKSALPGWRWDDSQAHVPDPFELLTGRSPAGAVFIHLPSDPDDSLKGNRFTIDARWTGPRRAATTGSQ